MPLDILFVHPNASKKIYQDLSKDHSAIEPPIWAALLANQARAKGRSVAILDCEALRLDPAASAKAVGEAGARLTAIVVYGQQPSASAQNMTGVHLLAAELKGLMPGAPILLIGLYPSALPEKCLADEPVDFVCQGEGPETVDGLLSVTDLRDAGQLRKVPGLWFREDGRAVHGPPAGLTAAANLDRDLPGMAWDLLPMDRYRTSNWHAFSNGNQKAPFASLYTSLGCPYHCSFCCINAPFGGSSFRHWSPDFMIGQFDKIAEMGITNIKIADEMFVLKQEHFLRLCEKIAARKHRFNIWAYARIDTVKEAYLDALKKAGVNWLALGIESGVKNVRADVVKGRFDELNIVDIVGKIRAHGINVIGNFIFGLPEDTLETMQQTLDMALELKCEFGNFYSCMAYPGSALHASAVAQKLELPASYEGFSQHAYECQPLPTKHLGAADVLRFRDRAFQTYYRDPGYLAHVKATFGQGTVDEIHAMVQIPLRRRLLEA
ncbi:MAG: cobalamin-dependent protein [Spirochaetes bacterium]|nr:cobalamin-dependent protein [Spirochaetota bacterium]